jgi:murein L,D-transpeptidase YcbB/YkuD
MTDRLFEPILLVAVSMLAAPGAVRAQDSVPREIEQRVELLRDAGKLVIAGATVRNRRVLGDVYEASSFAPLWTDASVARQLFEALRTTSADGLDPADYNVAAIDSLTRMPPGAVTIAELDLLRTDALMRVTHDLRFGRVTPTAGEATVARGATNAGEIGADEMLRLIRSGRLRVEIDALRPDHFVYRGLVGALADLRSIEMRGGWQAVPLRTLRPDSTDAAVPQLRRRLRAEGYATGVGSPPDVFDPALVEAVRSFQHRHGLNEDGIVGPSTIAELNVPVRTRIDQVRINLERARWLAHELPDTFLAVNIAGAKVYLVRADSVAFETRAVVGKTATRTPVFAAALRHIDLNPTWTVPPGIVGEVLARIRRDPGYLAREANRVLDGGGRRIDPATVDFARYSSRSFPYTFRQDPGPANPLGQVKLVFPNDHNVYLHDTPSRELFEREDRNFSHGCIRVKDPLRLAALVLDDPAWTVDSLRAAIAAGGTRTIPLRRPVPVLILYWTASTDLHGELHYYRDAYRRDARVLQELDGTSVTR